MCACVASYLTRDCMCVFVHVSACVIYVGYTIYMYNLTELLLFNVFLWANSSKVNFNFSSH